MSRRAAGAEGSQKSLPPAAQANHQLQQDHDEDVLWIERPLFWLADLCEDRTPMDPKVADEAAADLIREYAMGPERQMCSCSCSCFSGMLPTGCRSYE